MIITILSARTFEHQEYICQKNSDTNHYDCNKMGYCVCCENKLDTITRQCVSCEFKREMDARNIITEYCARCKRVRKMIYFQIATHKAAKGQCDICETGIGTFIKNIWKKFLNLVR